MDITVVRRAYHPDGILSIVSRNDTGAAFGVTLEHAFWDDSRQLFLPILQPGGYDCVRGQHRLDGMDHDFETFEVLHVVDQNLKAHSGVLIHRGNWNSDSKGCLLIGTHFAIADDPRDQGNTPADMVADSRVAFESFMKMQEGIDTFKLTVKG